MSCSKDGQLVFDWDRLENFLLTRDRPVGYEAQWRTQKIFM